MEIHRKGDDKISSVYICRYGPTLDDRNTMMDIRRLP